jgi:2-C-methyl-D-erythritol 4-phosphate cytidylyltransferase
VVIAGGGTGRRIGARLPKQYLKLRGVAILVRTAALFQGMGEIGPIVVVAPREHLDRTRRLLRGTASRKIVAIVAGGTDRQASVAAGIAAFPECPRFLLIHDAVRPFVTRATVRAVIRATKRSGAAVPGVRVTDTVKETTPSGIVLATPARERLWAVQTPQGFRSDLLFLAHRVARKLRYRGTDDSSLLERIGIPVRVVAGEYGNVKITTREDLRYAEFRPISRGR